MRYQKWGKEDIKIYCYSQQKSKKNLIKNPLCDNPKYNSKDVERIVLEDFFRITDLYEYKESLLAKANQSRVNALDVLEEKRGKLKTMIKNLYNKYAEYEDELLFETIEENKNELKRIEKLIENEKASTEAIKQVVEEKKGIKNIRNRWDSLTMSEKRNILRLAIDKVVLADGSVEIKYLL